MSGNLQVTSILTITLERLDNGTLAALNLMINGFGGVTPGTNAYNQALPLDLINEDGKPKDVELAEALSFLINKRVAEGKFV